MNFHSRFKWIIVCLATIFVGGVLPGASAQTSKEQVATVNGKEISRRAYDREIELLKARAAREGRPLMEPQLSLIKVQILDNMIDQELLYQESQKAGIEIEAAAIDAHLASIKQRFENEAVELLLLEAGRPDRHDFGYQDLVAIAGEGHSADLRVRQIGSIALSLCHLATGVADVLIAAVQARSVDLAAGFLILAESGGGVVALDGTDIWAQPLDLEKRSPFVAWRAGLDGPEIASRARGLGPALSLRP